MVTSAAAAADLLSDSKPLTFVLGGVGVTSALEDAGIPVTTRGSEAGAVVVGLATGLTYDWLREAATAVIGGARLVATNDDPTYPAEDGLWPGAGAILAAVETSQRRQGRGGRKALSPDAPAPAREPGAGPGLDSRRPPRHRPCHGLRRNPAGRRHWC